MEQFELERELERLHAESWGSALARVRRDGDLAQEVLQTAYVRMLSGAATQSGRSSLRTWVFGVIRMTALEELRRRAATRRDSTRVMRRLRRLIQRLGLMCSASVRSAPPL